MNKDLEPYQNLSLQDIEGEEWRDIEGFEGYYMISNMGRVKSLARKVWVEQKGYYQRVQERILTQTLSTKTNLKRNTTVKFSIRQEGIQADKVVSNLVAVAFIGEIENKHVLHKDKDIRNNHFKNLTIGDNDALSNYTHDFYDKNITSSKYRGVRLYQRKEAHRATYIADFYYNGKRIKEHFKTELEAAHKYDYYIKKFNLKRKGNFI